METNKLFVWSISWNLDWQDLKEAFSAFGEVTYVKVVKDRETGRSKGFGFVEFADIESAKKAKEEINFSYRYDLETGLQKLIDWRIETGVDKKK